MKLPRPRFTVRRLLVAVAISAALLGLCLVVQAAIARHRHILDLANKQTLMYRVRRYEMEKHSRNEVDDQIRLEQALSGFTPGSEVNIIQARRQLGATRIQVERYRRKLDHWGELGRKYQQASNRPWLALTPDPPEPD